MLINKKMQKVTRIAVLGFLMGLSSLSNAEPVTQIMNSGNPDNRVDLVFLGDGYTSSEMASYADHVQRLTDSLFTMEPFKSYKNFFNVHRIDVVSNESGSDHPERTPPVFVDTALNSTFNCRGTVRSICVWDNIVNKIITDSLPPSAQDVKLVIVNDTQLGGTATFRGIARQSIHTLRATTLSHEIGHNFGLLRDEYFSGTCAKPTKEYDDPNITIKTTRSQIKWNKPFGYFKGWIDPSTPIPTTGSGSEVGLYEGARHCKNDRYRPTFNSKMRTSSRSFGPVNEEQMIKRIYNLVAPLDSYSPLDKTVNASQGEMLPFKVNAVTPLSHDLSIDWYLDNKLIGTGPEILVDTLDLKLGFRNLEVKIQDPTNKVRTDRANVLQDKHSWRIHLKKALDSDKDGVSNPLDLCPNTDAGLSVDSDGCADNQQSDSDLPISAAQFKVTSFSNVAASPGIDAFNGKGLTNNKHDSNSANMWYSKSYNVDGKWLKVDLGGTYNLDYMKVWNYNKKGLEGNGIKQADIYVAMSDPGNNKNNKKKVFNPQGWTSILSNQSFTKSAGGAAISATDSKIALGVKAAYLAIKIDSNYGSGKNVGLSEIQLFGTPTAGVTTYTLVVNKGTGDGSYTATSSVAINADAPATGKVFDKWTGDTANIADVSKASTSLVMPASNVSITASYKDGTPTTGGSKIDPAGFTVTSFSNLATSPGIDAFNGKGLSNDKHGNNSADMWYSKAYSVNGKWLKVDLGGTYDLDYMKVWNFNKKGLENQGIKQADVYVAMTDPGNNVNNRKKAFNPQGWIPVLTGQAFTQSPGGTAVAATDTFSLGVKAAFLAIRVDSNHGSSKHVGLSEVQLFKAEQTGGAKYILNVVSGTGDGSYVEGAQVTIKAGSPPSGKVFDKWTGNTAGLKNIFSATTINVMPASNVKITATFKVDTGPIAVKLVDSSAFKVTTFSHSSASFGIDAFNGTGLSNGLHNWQKADSWYSTGYKAAGKWIKVDLGGTYDLDHLKVWNYNAFKKTGVGIKQADIFIALTDPGKNADNKKRVFNESGWTPLLMDQQFNKATGAKEMAATDVKIDLGGAKAAFLAIRVDSPHSGTKNVGLSEVQIFERSD